MSQTEKLRTVKEQSIESRLAAVQGCTYSSASKNSSDNLLDLPVNYVNPADLSAEEFSSKYNRLIPVLNFIEKYSFPQIGGKNKSCIDEIFKHIDTISVENSNPSRKPFNDYLKTLDLSDKDTEYAFWAISAIKSLKEVRDSGKGTSFYGLMFELDKKYQLDIPAYEKQSFVELNYPILSSAADKYIESSKSVVNQ